MVAQSLDAWLDAQPKPERYIPQPLTRKRHLSIVKSTEDGASLDDALAKAEVTHADVEHWLGRGELAKDGKYAQFHRDLLHAQAGHVAGLKLGTVQIAIPRQYAAHDYQKQLHALQLREWHRFVAACCGRRGGKTYGGGAHFATRMVADLEQKLSGTGRWEGQAHYAWEKGDGREPLPFLYYWVVAPTYALLDEPKIALQRVLGRLEEGGIIVHQTDRTWWLLGGIRIDFRSGDRPERLVSVGLDGLWCDEAARLKPAVWRDNLRPTLSDKNGWALFTTTPLGKNWFWEDVWAAGDEASAAELAEMRGDETTAADILDEEFAVIAWTTADNTSIPHLAEEMETARRQMPDALWRRNYKADFETFLGQCFELERSKHWRPRNVSVHRSALVRVWAGFDIGLTDHPSALSIVGEDRSGRLHELGTVARPKLLPHVAEGWSRRSVGDRSGWTSIAYQEMKAVVGDQWSKIPIFFPRDNGDWREYFRRCGFNVKTAFQEHADSVTWMSVALHNELITIGSSTLWRCLTQLRYPQDGEHSTKLWMEENDDPWDAFRYALSDRIREVQHGKLPAPKPMGSWQRV